MCVYNCMEILGRSENVFTLKKKEKRFYMGIIGKQYSRTEKSPKNTFRNFRICSKHRDGRKIVNIRVFFSPVRTLYLLKCRTAFK